jgi:hypothetical protein
MRAYTFFRIKPDAAVPPFEIESFETFEDARARAVAIIAKERCHAVEVVAAMKVR